MGIFQNNLMGAAAAAASAGGGDFYDHQIVNSVRFNRPNASKMSRSLGTATANTKWTFSSWVKLSSFSAGTTDGRGIFGGTGSTYALKLGFEGATANAQQLLFIDYPSTGGPNTGGVQTLLYTKKVFRDPSAWYHVVVAQDTTQGTASDRIKIYINGELQTEFENYTSGGTPTPFYPAQNSATINDSIHTFLLGVGNADNVAASFDGYQAETYFIDGTAYAGSDFGETKNGVWIPKDASGLTFGNNGFYLKYESSSDLGNDSSGNNNDYTVANISAHDQMLDSPTFNSDSNGGNMCTWNPLDAKNMAVPTEGNLSVDFSGSNYNQIRGTMSIGNSGKWYMELYKTNTYASYPAWGICDQNQKLTSSYTTPGYLAKAMAGIAWDFNASKVYKSLTYSESASGTEIGTTANVYTNTAQIVGMAIDLDNNKIFTHVDGTWDSGCGDPSSGGSGFDASGLSGVNNLVPVVLPSSVNSPAYVLVGGFGADSTFGGLTSAGSGTDVNGYGNFKYTVPTGYGAICQGNQSVVDEVDPAQTDDNFPSQLFDAQLWTGNGSSGRAITISGAEKPSLSVIKQRNSSNGWNVWTQGYNSGDYDSFGEFNSSGAWNANQGSSGPYTADPTASALTLTAYGQVNASSDTYLNYRWVANGGTTSTNSTGSVNVTQEVDPSGGFSISSYSGAGGTGNIGHGLSSAATFVMIKQTNGTNNWCVYAKGAQDSGALFAYLDTNSVFQSGSIFGNTEPSSTLVYLGDNNEVNHSGRDYLAFCWANVEGYIKSGFYTGNANTDGPFVYTGFKPALVIVRYIGSGESWVVLDNERDGYNVTNKNVRLNSNTSESSGSTYDVDFLSNGFKPRTTWEGLNGSGYRIVYLAIAKNPFKYATAR